MEKGWEVEVVLSEFGTNWKVDPAEATPPLELVRHTWLLLH
jgi:hypothetical protein